MKLKSSLLKIGVLISPITFLPTISCLSDYVYARTDIAGIQKTFSNEMKLIEKELSKNEELRKSLDQQKIIQISIAGKINDNSFAQMTWEGVSYFSKTIKNENGSYKVTSTPSSAEVDKAYHNALNKNYNIWVLTGWIHESFFAKWLQNPVNKNNFKKKNIKVISIDWDVNKYLVDDDGTEWGQGLSVNFRTQEASFLIGYSVAKFLSEENPGVNKKDKRIVNTTSGADASGSTNFNYGFLEGVRWWNKEQTTNDTKVLSNVYKEDKKVFLNTTYIENNIAIKNDFRYSVTGGDGQIFKGPSPSIIMPVAGDWSRAAANIIKETNNINNQWVVGVDSNMAISYGNAYKDFFITSSEKRIGIAVYKGLCFLTGISNTLKESSLFPDLDRMDWVIDKKDNKIKDTTGVYKNMSVIGGIKSNFVGASNSTIQDKSKANRFNEIINETQKNFFDNDKLVQELEQNPNKANYLLAKENLEKTNNDQTKKQFNEAIFQLGNIMLGEMNIDNNLYFNLVVDEINKWNK